jgi:hypothetical protein
MHDLFFPRWFRCVSCAATAAGQGAAGSARCSGWRPAAVHEEAVVGCAGAGGLGEEGQGRWVVSWWSLGGVGMSREREKVWCGVRWYRVTVVGLALTASKFSRLDEWWK